MNSSVKRGRPKFVTGPDGAPMSLDDLPPSRSGIRWNIYRKAKVVATIKGGMLTPQEVCTMYPGLSVEELTSWQTHMDQHGISGLRGTKLQECDGRKRKPNRFDRVA